MESNSQKAMKGNSNQLSRPVSGLNTEPLLTVDEVARYLRLQPSTVRGMARRGELPVVKVGRRWRFKRSLIENWLRNNMTDQV